MNERYMKIAVSPEIHKRAKLAATRQGMSLHKWTDRVLTEYLDKRNGSDARAKESA